MRLLLFFILMLLGGTIAQAKSPAIIITEIAASLPSKQEWIEICNISQSKINLEGWRFWEGITKSNPKGTKHKITLFKGDFFIDTDECAVIVNSPTDFLSVYPKYNGTIIDSSWSSLTEKGELIGLIDAAGEVVESFKYDPAPDGILVLIDGDWSEVMGKGTPGVVNSHPSGDQPLAENDQTINDDGEVESPLGDVEGQVDDVGNVAQNNVILPPKADAGEDVETFVGQEIVFDGSGSRGASLVYFWDFDDGERGQGQIVRHIYQIEGDYRVRLKVSNSIDDDEEDVKVVVREVRSGLEIVTIDKPPLNPHLGKEGKPLAAPPSKGKKPAIQGVVMVEPGIFAKTYFYMSSIDGVAGFQIYSSKSDFPDVFIGQLIEVRGVQSTYYDMTRIKISQPNDITIINGHDPPLAISVKTSEIDDTYLARLIVVSGEIVKESGKIFVENDGLLRLEIKAATGINKSAIKEGEVWKISGILDKTRGGYRLLPRHESDVERVSEAKSTKKDQKKSEKGEVLGKQAGDIKEALNDIEFSEASGTARLSSAKNKKNTVYKYLLATAAAAVIILIGLMVKKRGSRNQQT